MARLSKQDQQTLRAVTREARAQSGRGAAQGAAGRATGTAGGVAGGAAGAAPGAAGTGAAGAAGAGATGAAAGVTPPSSGAAHEADGTVGLGVDLVEIERMEQALRRTPRMLERLFTEDERKYAWAKARPATHYAAFFAAREAVLKALGTGFTGVGLHDVEVAHDAAGKPLVLLHNNASMLASEQGISDIQLSLSHTHTMAVAAVVALKPASKPHRSVPLDPLEELTREFKKLRSLLDDLELSGIITESATDDEASSEADLAADTTNTTNPSNEDHD